MESHNSEEVFFFFTDPCAKKIDESALCSIFFIKMPLFGLVFGEQGFCLIYFGCLDFTLANEHFLLIFSSLYFTLANSLSFSSFF